MVLNEDKGYETRRKTQTVMVLNNTDYETRTKIIETVMVLNEDRL